MAVFTPAQLSGMKRAQLQSLCKENELKANGKTEVLIQQLLDLNASSSSAAPSVAPAKKPVAAKKQAPVAVKSVARVEADDDDDDDDEMRMGSPVVVKKTKALLGGKKKAAAESAPLSKDSDSASTPTTGRGEASGSASSGEIAHTYGTSPATKTAIKNIQASLASFRSELTMTREQVSTVQSSLAASDSRTTAVCQRIEAEIETIRKERAEGQVGQNEAMGELEKLKGLLAEEVATGAEGRKALQGRMGQLEEKVERIERRTVSFEALEDVSSRVDALEGAAVGVPAQAAAEEHRPFTSAAFAPAFHDQTASPSLSDAPPIVSLNSFSSPTPSVAESTLSARRSTLNNSPAGAASRRSSPRKLMTSASTVALPTHMLSVPRPRASPSPGKGRASVTAAPRSPVPVSRQSLGKRARYSESEASDSSAGMAPSPSGSRPSTPAFGRRVGGVLGSAVRESGGWHLRKTLRLSNGTVDDDEDDEDEQEEEAMKEGSVGDTTVEDSRFADDSLAMQTAEEDSRSITQSEGDVDDDGDYFVQTKTGDELPAAVLPSVARAASPSAAAPSLFGPSFFARDPLPSTLRKSLPANSSASLPSTAAIRKSLPLAALPFPIQSPYKTLAIPAPRPSLAESSNRDSTGSGSSTGIPPTPQASKTLYGTERSLGDVTQGDDENTGDEAGMGSRFEDDEAVMTFGLRRGTPGKKWGVAKWGGFGSRA